MSCTECANRARYMAADPEFYRGEDTRCERCQKLAELAALRSELEDLREENIALLREREELRARLGKP